MTRELTPVQAEALKKDPDWTVVAERIAEQSDCENFPISIVKDILAKPGELIVSVLPRSEEYFAIGAIIAANQRPFAITHDDDGATRALKIEAARKEHAPGHFMYAEREISFGLTPGTPGDISNWMMPGIHSHDSDQIAADTAPSDFAIGTDDVNAFFEELAKDERLTPHKDRLVGMLFQTARLALDFNAPTPKAPEALQAALSQARVYYQAAQARARMLSNIRKEVAALEDHLAHESVIPRPAIHYEAPLHLPSIADIRKVQKSIAWPPTESELQYALKSYGEAIETLDALRTD